LETKHI